MAKTKAAGMLYECEHGSWPNTCPVEECENHVPDEPDDPWADAVGSDQPAREVITARFHSTCPAPHCGETIWPRQSILMVDGKAWHAGCAR